MEKNDYLLMCFILLFVIAMTSIGAANQYINKQSTAKCYETMKDKPTEEIIKLCGELS